MTFLWPDMLWLLAAVPALRCRLHPPAPAEEEGGAQVREPEHGEGGDGRAASGSGATCRRLLFLLALATMIVAVARPAAIVMLPTQQQTIILAMDVSGSMRARDVEPNRLVAAQEAAKAFVADLPRARAGRRGVLRGNGRGRAAAHAEARGRRRGHRQVPAAARHRHRQRHHPLARHHLPRRRHRRERIDLRAQRAARAPAGPRAHAGEERVHARPARLLHLGRHHPADGRPADDRARLPRGRQDGRRSRRAHLHGRRRHAER